MALVVPPATFLPYKGASKGQVAGRLGEEVNGNETIRATKGATTWLMRYPDQPLPLKREDVVRSVLGRLQAKDVLVSSLGGTSRETYMVLQEQGKPISRVFFVLGAMGHSFGVASGVWLGQTAEQERVVYCVEGDGSFLMHVGNSAVLADVGPRGIVHVVVYNGVHSSTGDQPLSLRLESYLDLAEGMAYTLKFFCGHERGAGQGAGVGHGGSGSRRREAGRQQPCCGPGRAWPVGQPAAPQGDGEGAEGSVRAESGIGKPPLARG